MHDAYRVDKGGQPDLRPGHARPRLLRRARRRLQHPLHGARRQWRPRPLEVYRFFRDEVGAGSSSSSRSSSAINVEGRPLFQQGEHVTDRSVDARAVGRFLVGVFEEWVRRDVGTVFVQMFDVALAFVGRAPGVMCIFGETCGDAAGPGAQRRPLQL